MYSSVYIVMHQWFRVYILAHCACNLLKMCFRWTITKLFSNVYKMHFVFVNWGNVMLCSMHSLWTISCTFENDISWEILQLVPLTAYVMGYYDPLEYWLSQSFKMANRVTYLNHGHALFWRSAWVCITQCVSIHKDKMETKAKNSERQFRITHTGSESICMCLSNVVRMRQIQRFNPLGLHHLQLEYT